LVRAQLRGRWLSWSIVALIIALSGAVVLATVAGARRTASAYPRMLRSTHAADLLVSPGSSGSTRFYDALATKLGPTAAVGRVVGYGAAPTTDTSTPLLIDASADGRFGFGIERPKLTAGRMPTLTSPDEVVADRVAARTFHLHPGSELHLYIAGAQEELPDPHKDPAVTLRVVGVGVTRDSIVAVNALAAVPNLLATPAFARRFGPDFYAFDGAAIVVAPGASRTAVGADAQQLASRFPETSGLFVADETQQAAKVEHAIRPQAVALALFAVLAGLAAILAVGQLVARRLYITATDDATLQALGMSRRQLLVVHLLCVGAVATAGAIGAVILAIVASRWMPIGPARLAEPHPGIATDWFVLGLGAVAIIALIVAGITWPAWRVTAPVDHDVRRRRVVPLAGWALRSGAPVTASIGVGHAVDPGRGRGVVPMRTALAGVAIAITALCGALTFGANLSRLVSTPKLYGQGWDVTADAQFAPLQQADIAAVLRNEPGVTAWTFGEHGDLMIDGKQVAAVGLIPTPSPLVAPAVTQGRAATNADEIALGTRTLSASRLHVGDSVTVSIATEGSGDAKPRPMHIVGTSVFPFFGRGSFTPTGLGTGAQLSDIPPGFLNPGSPPGPNFVLVRVANGGKHDANVARVVRDLGRANLCTANNQCSVTTASRPVDVLNYARVRATPVVLAFVLGLLAMVVFAYLLITSMQRRQHEFAILKTLGFTRRQVWTAVASQATTVAVLALVIGVPAGVAAGRFAWDAFAKSLGVTPEAATPFLLVTVTVVTALVFANALAAVPGILAGRARPARELRTQ
jgi:ABC-type antimicrobial peptide transport system permease subunit